MIPKYAYLVTHYWKVGQEVRSQSKSFESLGAAMLYFEIKKRERSVYKIQVTAILEEWVNHIAKTE